MKIVGVIQARMGSSRLPGKVLLPLAGLPLLAVHSERIQDGCRRVDEWWLATTNCSSDDLTAEWGQALGLRVFRGSETDVLSRFCEVATLSDADWIIRTTADDPYMHGSIVERLIDTALETDFEYVGPGPKEPGPHSPAPEHFPIGFVPELISRDALDEMGVKAVAPSHREHVLWWWRETRPALCLNGEELPVRNQWNWTVDTHAQYQQAVAAFDMLGGDWKRADYEHLVRVFDQNETLFAGA
jgi:spore coat polysaccharide biosynthesis protein SpsF